MQDPSVSGPRRRRASAIRSYALGALMAVGIYMLTESIALEGFRVASASMENTLLVGDHVLANKLIYGTTVPLVRARLPAVRSPAPGDILLFRHPDDPGEIFIKRCVAVAGQRVAIRDRRVWVDDAPTDDAPGVSFQAGGRARSEYGPVRVPPGMLFVLGDNRNRSSDSREWGFLPRHLVLGKAELVIWSRGPDGDDDAVTVRWDRIGRRIR